MIVSVHQPQYLPWLGYFHKICQSDIFVFLDNVQYKHREYQNRNRIRTSNGWMWLTVPIIKGHAYPNISEVYIDNSQGWSRKHWRAITLNYAQASFFNTYKSFFNDLYGMQWERLIDLNIYIIKKINEFLGITKKIYFESELNIKTINTQRIIDICKTLKADTYLSGSGGKNYLNEELFRSNNIKLVYQDFRHPEYAQRYQGFVPFMSAIDLLFNHGPDSLRILLSST
ncbi:MAG: WbqC family protein [Candidatus Omnitrophica bacterium]|nr:WbqC family protein [Candidatus Omnitrophota bacterium]